MPNYVDQQSSAAVAAAQSCLMKHTASRTLPWAIHDPRTWISRHESQHHYMEDRSKRKSRREGGESEIWSSMVMNIHYECMTLYNTIIVQYGMHVYQYKIRGVPVNSNPPAVTCMSALDEMIPVAQICLNIWAITEIELMTSRKNIPAVTDLPAFEPWL